MRKESHFVRTRLEAMTNAETTGEDSCFPVEEIR
jgi:hypothetical protein